MVGACELVRLSAPRHVGMLGCRMQRCIPRINTLGENVRCMKGMIIGSEELRPEDITLGVHTLLMENGLPLLLKFRKSLTGLASLLQKVSPVRSCES